MSTSRRSPVHNYKHIARFYVSPHKLWHRSAAVQTQSQLLPQFSRRSLRGSCAQSTVFTQITTRVMCSVHSFHADHYAGHVLSPNRSLMKGEERKNPNQVVLTGWVLTCVTSRHVAWGAKHCLIVQSGKKTSPSKITVTQRPLWSCTAA
jgi:hypothetical protein